jgi:hypothetical protein
METLFGWIHLSDLHVGHGDTGYQAEQRLVLDVLADDIRAQVSEIGRSLEKPNWRPDTLIVSGDIAFSANVRDSSEYEQASDWLLSVAKEVGIPQTEILMVPGNHDIRRLARENDRAAFRLIKLLREGDERIDDALSSPDDRGHLLGRAAAFTNFAERISPIHSGLSSEKDFFSWVRNYERSGIQIRVAGVNSALLCNDDGDMKRLALGFKALASAFDSGSRPSSHAPWLSHIIHLAGLATNWMCDAGSRKTRKSTCVAISTNKRPNGLE